MNDDPSNDKLKPRKPEHTDIARARADVTNAANEYERMTQAAALALRKLQQAQATLDAELKKPRRE